MSNLPVSLALVALLAHAANAQPRDLLQPRPPIPAPSEALELSIAGGSLQGTGDHGSTVSPVDDNLGPGWGGDISLGIRVTPNLALAGYTSLAGFSRGAMRDHVALGSIGFKADWHFDPFAPVDPWLSLGAGVKQMWVGNRDSLDSELLGVELVRLQLGVDYRLSESVAIGPAVTASATMFTHERTDGEYGALDDRDVNLMFTAGVVGRFDFLGRAVK